MTQPPLNCVKCKKPFRPRGTSAKVYPNTALHAGKGQCTSCAATARRAKAAGGYHKPVLTPAQKKERAAKLQKARNDKRSKGANKTNPKTGKRQYLSALRPMELGDYTPGEHRDVTNLRYWLEERRGRGIPVQGLPDNSLGRRYSGSR